MEERMRISLVFLSAASLALCASGYLLLAAAAAPVAPERPGPAAATQGALEVLDAEGKPAGLCPLKHTDVKAEISGFLSRVTVTQQFENPYKDPIEAVYTFPLPQDAAVDRMTMKVGDRTIRGTIKPREEARAIYDAARERGQVASLLDQERPNIFTQSVANILPGARIDITISYVETLEYEDGSYQFVFPMVVGPRYIPGQPVGKQAGGWAPDTNQVPDASRITPQVAPEGTRAGHDISIDVALDAGVPIVNLRSTQHEVDVQQKDARSAAVRLKARDVIPNKDFILSYDVAGEKIEDAILTHAGERGGYFTFILQPPDRVAAEDVTPKEIVFVLDTSGSMSGFPMEKAKEAMKLALDGLHPRDTFNLITFAGDTHVLFPAPVPATPDNLARAQEFLATRRGAGGTEMMKAIRAALDPSDSQEHVRVVCFMTDGYIGNDMEVIAEVQKHPNARVFSFGIGSSVNRFLLDKMAEEGRGEVAYVTLTDDGSAAARRFHERVRSPLLTDVTVDWGGLPVTDVYPARIPDVFSAKPVVVSGRYAGTARGTVRLAGKSAGRDVVREIAVDLRDREPRHDVLAQLWARRRIDDLMRRDYAGMQRGAPAGDVKEQVTQLGLEYGLMTQFTSFVAVEEVVVTDGGKPRRVDVPVDMPEGVSHEGVFGERGDGMVAMKGRALMSSPGIAGGIAPPAPTARPHRAAGVGSAKDGRQQPRTEAAGAMADEVKAEPEEQNRRGALAKLDPALARLVDRLKAGTGQPDPAEAAFVKDGKAEVQVWLSEKSPEVIERLKQLGFEVIVDQKGAQVVIGRIPVEKLAALAELEGVRYVAPYRG
jgi:Ca-activated chloride channel family protein